MLVAIAAWLMLAQTPAAIEQQAETQVKAQPTADNWQKLGLARFLQNHFDAAIPALRQAVAKNASLWPSHLFLGISLYRTNQFSEALASLKTARRLAPAQAQGSDDVDYWLGAAYIALKQPWAGLQSLEALRARNPQHKNTLAMLARAYADLSGTLWNGIAEREFETPAGLEVHGHALESEGNVADALAAWHQSRARAPERPGPGREMGRLLLQQGRTAEALSVLEAERRLAPRDPETCYLTGLALLQAGRTADAVPLLEAAYKWVRNDIEVPLALAQALLALKRYSEAVAPARKALELEPSSAAAKELLAAASQNLAVKP